MKNFPKWTSDTLRNILTTWDSGRLTEGTLNIALNFHIKETDAPKFKTTLRASYHHATLIGFKSPV